MHPSQIGRRPEPQAQALESLPPRGGLRHTKYLPLDVGMLRCHVDQTLMVRFSPQNFTSLTSFYRTGASTPPRQPLLNLKILWMEGNVKLKVCVISFFFHDYFILLLCIERNRRHTLQTDTEPSYYPTAACLAGAKAAVQTLNDSLTTTTPCFCSWIRERVDGCPQSSELQRERLVHRPSHSIP